MYLVLCPKVLLPQFRGQVRKELIAAIRHLETHEESCCQGNLCTSHKKYLQ